MARIDRVLIKQVQGPDGPEVRFQVNEAKERKGEGWEEGVAKILTDAFLRCGLSADLSLEVAIDHDDDSVSYALVRPESYTQAGLGGELRPVAALFILMCQQTQRIVHGNDCSVAKAR